jgi:hypothetical protein
MRWGGDYLLLPKVEFALGQKQMQMKADVLCERA